VTLSSTMPLLILMLWNFRRGRGAAPMPPTRRSAGACRRKGTERTRKKRKRRRRRRMNLTRTVMSKSLKSHGSLPRGKARSRKKMHRERKT
jgi:hypothetical protein